MPTAFISYANESEKNKTRLDDFVRTLRSAGIDPLWDGDSEFPRGIAEWMARGIITSDWRLVVCDELYSKYCLGNNPPGVGRGVQFEYGHLRQLIYRSGLKDTIVPVGFGPYNERRIPAELQDVPYYDLTLANDLDRLVSRLQSPAPRRIEEVDDLDSGDRQFELSLQPDIERLRQVTQSSLARLSRRTSFLIEGTSVSIPRLQVSEIVEAGTRGTLLIGEPGSGKSGIIASAANALVQQGAEVVILDVDALEQGASAYELRQRLGLRHEIATVLANWPGDGERVLFVDALDVARSSSAARAYRDLILQVSLDAPRWRIVASVRTYEYQHSVQLREIFRSLSSNGNDAAAVDVSGLNEGDWQRVAARSAKFAALLSTASDKLLMLLTNPFNLSLCAAVLDGSQDNELRTVRTQYQLLNLYWDSRVRSAHEAASSALRRMATLIVRDRSTLVSTDEIGPPQVSEALLSAGVIVDGDYGENPSVRSVRFRHSLLLDYAVERTLFLGRADGLAETLSTAADAVLLLHSAIRLHFQGLWGNAPAFWRDALAIERSGAAPVAASIAPIVAAELVHNIHEISGIVDCGEFANRIAHRFVRAAERFALGADRASVAWLPLAQFLDLMWQRSASVHASFDLLWSLSRRLQEASTDAKALLASTARSMLAYVFSSRDEPGGDWYARAAIQTVCETYQTDCGSSAVALRPLLDTNYLRAHGFTDARWLAWNFEPIYDSDPEFAIDVYRAFFSYYESDQSRTLMSTGVMPMSSNRRQDYDAALHALGEAFVKFARRDILAATRALGAALESSMRTGSSIYRLHRQSGAECHFRNHHFELPSDGSQFWDALNSFDPSTSRRMLTGYSEALSARLAEGGFDPEPLLEIAAETWRVPAPWRRLLMAGKQEPAFLGVRLYEFLSQEAVLAHPDLSESAAGCAAAVEPFLNGPQRIELIRVLEQIRARRPRLVSKIAREFRQGVLPIEWTEVPPSPSDSIETTVGAVTMDDLMERARAEGEPTDESIRIAVNGAEDYFKAFPREKTAQALSALAILVHALDASRSEGSDRDFGWSVASAVARQLAEQHKDSLDSSALSLVRQVLIRASRERQPEPSQEMDEQFERWQSWGSPSARVDAVFGVFRLFSPEDMDVWRCIDELSRDIRAEVRYNVVTHARELPEESAWQIADRAASDENTGVKVGLLAFLLPHLWHLDEERAAAMVLRIYAQHSSRNLSELGDLNSQALNFIEFLAIVRQDRGAIEIVERVLFNSENDATTLIFIMSRRLEGILQQDIYNEGLARLIASYFERALEISTDRSLARVFDPPPTEDPEISRDGKLVNELAARLYFASGAYEGVAGGPRAEASPRFYPLVRPLLQHIVRWPIAQALHHTVLILDQYLVMDPRGAFLLFAAALRTGAPLNLHFDALAIEPIAEFVERCLAEYHELLESDRELRAALVDVINLLADAGVERYQRVITNLDMLYR